MESISKIHKKTENRSIPSVVHRKLTGVLYLLVLTVFVGLQQGGRAAWAVSRGGEAQDGTKVPGELLQPADQPGVASTRVIGGDGDHQQVLWIALWPDEELGKIPASC